MRWNRVILALLLLLARPATQANSCSVPGGTSSSPTDFAPYVGNATNDEFVLQDGWYTFPKLARSAILIRAEHDGKAQIKNGFAITASGVTIDGISRAGEQGAISVNAPGATIRNCSFSERERTI